MKKSQYRPFLQNRPWLIRPLGVLHVVAFFIIFPVYLVINLRHEIADGWRDYWSETFACFDEIEDD